MGNISFLFSNFTLPLILNVNKIIITLSNLVSYSNHHEYCNKIQLFHLQSKPPEEKLILLHKIQRLLLEEEKIPTAADQSFHCTRYPASLH